MNNLVDAMAVEEARLAAAPLTGPPGARCADRCIRPTPFGQRRHAGPGSVKLAA